MKRFLFLIAAIALSAISFSQSTVIIRADSTKLYKVGGSNELVLQNSTRTLPNTFLKNVGNGVTKFANAIDSFWVSGGVLYGRRGTDTLQVVGLTQRFAVEDATATQERNFNLSFFGLRITGGDTIHLSSSNVITGTTDLLMDGGTTSLQTVGGSGEAELRTYANSTTGDAQLHLKATNTIDTSIADILHDKIYFEQNAGNYYVVGIDKATGMENKAVFVYDSLTSKWEWISKDSVGGAPTLQQVFDREIGGSVLTKNDTINLNYHDSVQARKITVLTKGYGIFEVREGGMTGYYDRLGFSQLYPAGLDQVAPVGGYADVSFWTTPDGTTKNKKWGIGWHEPGTPHAYIDIGGEHLNIERSGVGTGYAQFINGNIYLGLPAIGSATTQGGRVAVVPSGSTALIDSLNKFQVYGTSKFWFRSTFADSIYGLANAYLNGSLKVDDDGQETVIAGGTAQNLFYNEEIDQNWTTSVLRIKNLNAGGSAAMRILFTNDAGVTSQFYSGSSTNTFAPSGLIVGTSGSGGTTLYYTSAGAGIGFNTASSNSGRFARFYPDSAFYNDLRDTTSLTDKRVVIRDINTDEVFEIHPDSLGGGGGTGDVLGAGNGGADRIAIWTGANTISSLASNTLAQSGNNVTMTLTNAAGGIINFSSQSTGENFIGNPQSQPFNIYHFTSKNFSFLSSGRLDLLGTDARINFKEISAPGTPAAATVDAYAKSDGLLYGKDDAGTETKLSNETHVENTYTATLFNTTNIAASTAAAAYYVRSGDWVHVWGYVNIDATTATTLSELGMSLPIASTITENSLSGTAAYEDNTAVKITGDAANGRAKWRFTPQTATDNRYSFHFSYKFVAP